MRRGCRTDNRAEARELVAGCAGGEENSVAMPEQRREQDGPPGRGRLASVRPGPGALLVPCRVSVYSHRLPHFKKSVVALASSLFMLHP